MARVSRMFKNPMFKSPLINNPLPNGGDASYFPPSNPKQKPKVISIPVRFVGSETTSKKKIDPSIAAIKIQSIFRGFLVRRNAKIVREIEAEVDEIEKKFGADREMDLIVGDAKERLRINEMLMGLLLRLDSVRGVRDYRKRVIRRVILIQEMLDSISAAESVDRKRSEDETLETPQSEKPDQEMADWTSAVGADDRNQLKVDAVTSDVGSDDRNQLKVDAEIGEGATTVNEKPDREMMEELKPGATETLESKLDQETGDSMLTVESANQNLESEIPQGSKPEVDVEVKPLEGDDEAVRNQISTGWELLETQEANDVSSANQESVIVVEEEEEEDNKETVMKESENEKLKEVMERVVAENEKLKGLVAELCQRSAQQCRLMGGLAERVEYLEKAVQKMEKKNKKRRKEAANLPAFLVDKK